LADSNTAVKKYGSAGMLSDGKLRKSYVFDKRLRAELRHRLTGV
jgi:hypothetical protein